MGRDVVGFCAPQRHEVNWDNYQCKQYRVKVGTAEGILAVGKIFYWASQGHFTVPRTFYFVAPNGLNTNLLGLINRPSLFRKTMVDEWDKYCATKIVQKTAIPMSDGLRADRKSTRLTPVTNAHLVCRLLLEKKKRQLEHITHH